MPNETTRARLIEVANEAFFTHGYGAASLEEIAKSARISKKTIYKYFDSKAALFAAVVEDALQALPTQQLVESDENAPDAALRQFLLPAAAIGLSKAGLRFHWIIFREADTFPELLPAFTYAIRDFSESIVRWMSRQIRQGRLAINSPERAASTLLMLVFEETRRDFALRHRSAPTPDEQADIVEFAIRIFLHGALAESSGT